MDNIISNEVKIYDTLEIERMLYPNEFFVSQIPKCECSEHMDTYRVIDGELMRILPGSPPGAIIGKLGLLDA